MAQLAIYKWYLSGMEPETAFDQKEISSSNHGFSGAICWPLQASCDMAMAASSGVTAEAQHVEDEKKTDSLLWWNDYPRCCKYGCMAVYGQVLVEQPAVTLLTTIIVMLNAHDSPSKVWFSNFGLGVSQLTDMIFKFCYVLVASRKEITKNTS